MSSSVRLLFMYLLFISLSCRNIVDVVNIILYDVSFRNLINMLCIFRLEYKRQQLHINDNTDNNFHKYIKHIFDLIIHDYQSSIT